MGCLVERFARIASVTFGLFLLVGSVSAQEVVRDSYVVTYNRSDAHRAAASIGALGLNERSLGGDAAEIKPPHSAEVLSTAAVSATEQYGAKHREFCNDLIASRDDIGTCSPNWVVRTSALPADPQLSSLWGLTGANGVGAAAAWDTTVGSNEVVVAIIDTGIDYTHPDLAANVWSNPAEIAGNGIDDDSNGVIDDVHGVNYSSNGRGIGDPFDDNSHGTHVAGTIGAVGNNNVGVSGINWRVKLMGLKFLAANGSGSTAGAIQALNYLILMKNRGVNVRVVNNSWGGGGDSPALREAISRANDAGILFTAAAGNSSQNIDETPQYPAAYNLPNMLKVAAIDRDGNLAYFSNYGARLVDMAAPGVDILSTVPGNRYASYSGTSMATPHVSGVAALYLSNHPNATTAELKAALIGSARPLPSVVGVTASGRTLDAARAVTDTLVPVEAPAAVCPYEIATVSNSVDTAADGKSPVVKSDEDGFYRVSLPFSFPFVGVYRDAMYISPNGVVYFGGKPSAWDNRNQSIAPTNSIAALHTDLFPDPSLAAGLGVRVSAQSGKVTVAWRARVYSRQNLDERVIARLTLYPSGVINLGYSISSQGLEGELAGATIGVTGANSTASSTYAGTVRNGLGLRMTPSCQPQATAGTHVKTVSAVAGGADRAVVSAGGRVVVRGRVRGQGVVQLVGRIDGRRCEGSLGLSIVQERLKVFGRIPAGTVAKRVSFALIGDDGRARVAALRLRGSERRAARKRTLSTRNACDELMKSFN
jgi:subtilisin family serine protease